MFYYAQDLSAYLAGLRSKKVKIKTRRNEVSSPTLKTDSKHV